MFNVVAICDRCKHTEAQSGRFFDKYKSNWQEVEVKISQYHKKEYLFCEDCSKKLGLIEKTPTRYGPSVQTVEEKLFEVISEIIASQVEEQGGN